MDFNSTRVKNFSLLVDSQFLVLVNKHGNATGEKHWWHRQWQCIPGC